MTELKREIKFIPAYNKVAEGFGRHGMDILWVLSGPEGAITLRMFTNWYTPEDQKEFHRKPSGYFQRYPWGVDLSYHSHVPHYEGQSYNEHCIFLEGKPCYAEGTSIGADEIMDDFILQGEDVIWKKLEEWYESKLKNNLTYEI